MNSVLIKERKKELRFQSFKKLTQMALMSDSWPVKVCLHMPSRTSQSLAEASQAPETNNRESGAKDRLMTSPVCPANVVVCWPVSMSQSALQKKIHKFSSFFQWQATACKC